MKYAVLIKTSITIPGDERSRTNPGHGYPEHTVDNTEFREFASQDDLKRWIKANERSNYRVIEFQELEVRKEVTVDFKRPGVTRSS